MQLYTVREVAEMLKKDPNTIHIYIRAGKLKGFKVGREWRFTQEQIQEFLAKGEKN